MNFNHTKRPMNTMGATKQLGIWMDYSKAVITEITDNIIVYRRITPDFNSDDKEQSLKMNESRMDEKEQQQSGYYKRIAAFIKGFKEVLLFGPTEAKSELMNFLKADRQFDTIKIEVISAERMTSQQIYDYVTKYFK